MDEPADPFASDDEVGSLPWMEAEAQRLVDALTDLPSLAALFRALDTLHEVELRRIVFAHVIADYKHRDDLGEWVRAEPVE